MEEQKLEKKLKILLVEDSLDKPEFKEIADYVRKASDEKVYVELAVDVKSGLEKIEKTDYDLVVTDLGLPQKPGTTTEELIQPEYEKAFEEYISPSREKPDIMALLGKLKKETKESKSLESLPTLTGVAERTIFGYSGRDVTPITKAIGGLYVFEKAKEKGIPATVFTDIQHFQEGIIGTILAGYMSIEQLEQITSQIDESFDTSWEPISSKAYVKTDQIYVGSKKIRDEDESRKKLYVADTKTFADVILDAAKSYKLIEK